MLMQTTAIMLTSASAQEVALIEVTAEPRNGAGEGEKFVRADKSFSAKLKTSHFGRKRFKRNLRRKNKKTSSCFREIV